MDKSSATPSRTMGLIVNSSTICLRDSGASPYDDSSKSASEEPSSTRTLPALYESVVTSHAKVFTRFWIEAPIVSDGRSIMKPTSSP